MCFHGQWSEVNDGFNSVFNEENSGIKQNQERTELMMVATNI